MSATRSPSFISGSWPVLRKKIAALADRTDDIHRFARGVLRFADRNDLVVTLVERGPDQIVHPGIDDHEFLVLGLLDVADAGEEDAGIADEQTARLEQHPQADRAQAAAGSRPRNPGS